VNLVDSSGWLEYFADGPNAEFFASPVQDLDQLVVPTLSLYEVFKRIAQQKGEGVALQAIAVMQQGAVVDLNVDLAIEAARLSLEMKLPMADSIILATAQAFGATLWTQDVDFKGIKGVRFIKKRSK
jgi:predicted nucleic acid-binding protein